MIKKWFVDLITKAVADAVSKAPIEARIAESIEKLRYDYLPHGACWMCSMPVSRTGGYQMWRGKMFCTEECLKKYAGLTEHPQENYKILNGDSIEVFPPKN